jgi:hypothetical protein
MKTSISKEANPNYLSKVVKLKNLQKHPNADRLQTVVIDFQTVITGLDAKDGDLYVYFPIECKINKDFLSFTNSFREKTLNKDQEQVGFFEENCRVKAMKLRSEKSCGYIVPIKIVEEFTKIDISEYVNQEFDTIGEIKMLEKFVVRKRNSGINTKQGKQPKISRIIEGQVHLHVDTENLRKNAHKIKPSDLISVTYKTHGTSFWVSNVLVKKNLTWVEKLLIKFGVNVVNTEYDLLYGSRKVVKNQSFDDPKAKDSFYGYDLWQDIKNEIGEFIPKGFSLYGEYTGFDKNCKHIQKDYDYGCDEGKGKIEVYRITQTTPDGLVLEFSYPQIEEFCLKFGLTPSYIYYTGKAVDMYDLDVNEHWNEAFIKQLEKNYNEKKCFMCKNSVPEEGIVIRKESLFNCESYKLKSFAFLEKESKDLDKGEVNIEDNQDE